jgi:hypothetical protein
MQSDVHKYSRRKNTELVRDVGDKISDKAEISHGALINIMTDLFTIVIIELMLQLNALPCFQASINPAAIDPDSSLFVSQLQFPQGSLHSPRT